MDTIPEISSQLVKKSLLKSFNINAKHIFIVGDKKVGKTTLLHSFLEKTDAPRDTLVLDYSFGRKFDRKQSMEKTVCHLWEHGGRIEMLKNVLPSISFNENLLYCIMVDLSKIKTIWNTLELSIQILNEVLPKSCSPEIVIFGGKYDIFNNYDSEIKKVICTTMRSMALMNDAHLIFYSNQEPMLLKRAKDILQSAGFGNGLHIKERNTNFTKPLVIAKNTDSWESIGIPSATMHQIKSRHLSRISSEVTNTFIEEANLTPTRTHNEVSLDALVKSKYEELRLLDSLDINLDEYLQSSLK